MKCGVWECEDFASSLAEKIKRLSREGHGRDRVSLNYRSFMFGKLPPPACPGLCYEIEPVSGGVDSASRSVVEELRSAPESELEAADPLDHLHKIGQEVPLTEDSIPSSTSIQGRWEIVPGTWQQCQVK